VTGGGFPAIALAAAIALRALPTSAEEPVREELPGPARGGEVDVRVTPDRMTLGEVGVAQVAVKLPAGALRVRLKAAAGKVRGVKIERDGRATGTYRPPDSFVPRIDVVAALVETRGGLKVGFAVIQLTGQGEAILKTRPKSQARIRIGEREYGPVQADRRGEARIRIQVPPGAGVGYDDRGAPVDLGVPAMPRVAVFPERAKLRTAERATLEVYAFAARDDGGPDAEAAVSLSVDAGEISSPRAIGGGGFAATFTPPAEGAGRVEITAFIEGDAQPGATAAIELVPGAGATAVPPPTSGDAAAGEDAPLAHRVDAALEVGFASNFGTVNTFNVEIDLAYELFVRAVGLRFGAGIGTSASDDEGRATIGEDEPARAMASLWLVPITGRLGCRFPFATAWSFSLRAEAGAAMMDSMIRVRAGGAETDPVHERDWFPAAGGAVELSRALGPGAVLAGARYLHVFREPATISGRLAMLYVDVGYRLDFDF